MIRKILLGFFITTSLYSHAQENKNKFVVNANIQFNPTNNPINFGGASIGYFFTNNFSVGITGNQRKDISKFEQNNQNMTIRTTLETTDSYTGAFARYNQLFKNDRLGFFLDLNTVYMFRKYTRKEIYDTPNNSNQTITLKDNGYRLALSPGIIYFINHWFSMEATLGDISYVTISQNDPNGIHKKSSEFNSSLFTSGIRLGLSFYFGCKKTEVKSSE